jgi:NAD(P)H-hydrate epimerase
MRILDTAQMREADRRTIEEIGIPARVLMENAGRQVAAALERAFEDLALMRVSVLCGRGNNGGDGFVVARVLFERGVDVRVYLFAGTNDVAGDARANLDVLRNLGLDVVEIADAATWELRGTHVLSADLVVDALFGTGVRGPLTGLAETVVADLNASDRPVVSIDLPSGLSADHPNLDGPAVAATMTVALAAPKLPLILPPAEHNSGTLVVVDIGIPSQVIDEVEGPRIDMLTRATMAGLVEARRSDSHKGDYGRVLIVAGSTGRTGAAVLAARAALRSGAGLVTIAAPQSVIPIIAGMGAEYMTLPLPETAEGTVSADGLDAVLAFRADVIAVGPGLGSGAAVAAFVHGLVERSGVPLILDADALNAFVDCAEALVGRDDAPIVITPHPGEMARLLGTPIDRVQRNRLAIALGFANDHRVHVVLKGHRTIVADPDGAAGVNLTGNPGMATAGAGDVLTGMMAAWFAQLRNAGAAARLAVHLHGMAGDLAQADRGQTALIAGDLIAHLGDAVQELQRPRARTHPAEEH